MEDESEVEETQTEVVDLMEEASGNDKEEDDDNICSTCGRIGLYKMRNEEMRKMEWLECDSCGEWIVFFLNA